MADAAVAGHEVFHGLDCHRLTLPCGDTVLVALQGAHVLSWVSQGRERLYLSPANLWDGQSAIRGGVPVCFPQFNQRGTLPKHGFARNMPWKVDDAAQVGEALASGDAAHTDFTLSAHTGTLAIWQQAFVARELAPTVGGNFAVFGIQTDDDVAAKSTAGVAQEARVFDRCCADDDVAQARIDVFFYRVKVTDTATELHGNVVPDRFQNGFDGRFVLGCASERTVQVNQVQATCAFGHPVERHLRWVFTEGSGLLHVALFEAHAMAVFEINGRY